MDKSRKNDISYTHEFLDTITEIVSQLKRHDIHSKAYHDPHLPHFSKLNSEQKNQSLENAKSFLNCLQLSTHQSWTYKDDLHFLWNSLKSLNLTPSSDIIEHIKQNDAVEIFSLNNVQIWRNLASMDVCSYTIEEMHSVPWEKRYIRNEKTMSIIASHFEKMFALNPPSTYLCNIKNVITETFGEERLTLNANHKALCKLFDSKTKSLAGYIVVSEAEILSKNPNSPQEKSNLYSING